MKKTAKSLLIVMLMALLVFALTGCKNSKKDNKEEKGDVLVATKQQDDDEYFGSYKDIMEVSFKDDKANQVIMAMEFDDEETAQGVAAIFALTSSTEEERDYETKQEGNKFMIIMDAKAYAEQQGVPEEQLTKEYIKQVLEESGYEVK